MSYKIWLDKEGKEVKREVKGRGRISKGFVKRDDDNWYTQEGVVEEVKQEIVKTKQETEEAQTVVVQDVYKTVLKKKTSTATQQIHASSIQKVCSTMDTEEKDGVVVLHNSVPLIKGLEEYGLNFNFVYERVELDTRTGQVRIFSIKTPNGAPVIVVNNAIVIES